MWDPPGHDLQVHRITNRGRKASGQGFRVAFTPGGTQRSALLFEHSYPRAPPLACLTELEGQLLVAVPWDPNRAGPARLELLDWRTHERTPLASREYGTI